MNSDFVIILLFQILLSISCKTPQEAKLEDETNCYYTIKNRVIDKSLSDSMAMICCMVNFTGLDGETIYTEGEVYYNSINTLGLYEVGEKYIFKIPAKKTVLYIGNFQALQYYRTDTLFLKSQEKIELNIELFARFSPAHYRLIKMHEKK